MPRDYLADNGQEPQMEKLPGRDFLAESEPQQESLGKSAALAIPRVAEDVIKGGYHAIQQIPGLFNAAKTEVPGVVSALQNNPKHALGQVGAGFAELGQNVFNTPHDVINYLATRLNLFPKELNKKVQMARMPDSTNEINATFGTPNQPGEALLRGVTRNALNIMGGAKAASVLNPANLTAKNIAKNVIKEGEKNKKIYSGLYNDLWDEAAKKGYSDMSHVVPSIDMDTIRKFTPKKKIAGVEDFIKGPSIQNAHAAKSDLMKIKRDLDKKSTLVGGERKQIKAISDAIDNIQSNMFKDAQGKIDPKMLEKYNTIQKGYANEVVPYANKALGKFKRKEISAKELVNSLQKGEFAAKRGSAHPAIGIRKNALPIAGSAGLLGTGALAKTIWDAYNKPSE